MRRSARSRSVGRGVPVPVGTVRLVLVRLGVLVLVAARPGATRIDVRLVRLLIRIGLALAVRHRRGARGPAALAPLARLTRKALGKVRRGEGVEEGRTWVVAPSP